MLLCFFQFLASGHFCWEGIFYILASASKEEVMEHDIPVLGNRIAPDSDSDSLPTCAMLCVSVCVHLFKKKESTFIAFFFFFEACCLKS